MAHPFPALFSKSHKKPGFFVRIYRALRRTQPFYWLRTHTVDRYHMVDCGRQHKLTGYRWGWQDVDHLMLLALFELLCRFIENEDGLANLQFQVEAIRQEALKAADEPETFKALVANAKEADRVYKEVALLHAWWTVLRPLQHKLARQSRDYNIDRELDETDTKMMTRLIQIRQSLWT